MKIAFRVDASSRIGTGHFARCLTLADALRAAGVETRLVCRHVPEMMAQHVRAGGHAVSLLPPGGAAPDGGAYGAWLGTSQQDDARASAAALADGIWDGLVVDHYALDATWETALRPLARRILAIDDLANRTHACDTLLDQNLQPDGPDRYACLLPAECRTLVGPRFALLRPDFRDAAARDKSQAKRINVFFGGIDAAGMTLRALDEIASLPGSGVAVDVVAGAGNPDLDIIRRRCTELGAVLHVQSTEMARLLAEADLGLGAGGATSWERCRMGLPAIVVSVADNQRSGCQALDRHGVARCLGDAASLKPGVLREAAISLMADAPARMEMARRGQALVDGRGTERAMLHMMRETVTLRPAVEGDARFAWQWRNHPRTRFFSGESAELAWDSHLGWWQASLKSRSRDLLIAACGGVDFGVLRFDHNGTATTVSIYLDPALGELGLGSAALRASNDWIARHRGARTLTARILKINGPSQRSFAAAGYREAGEESWMRMVNGTVLEATP